LSDISPEKATPADSGDDESEDVVLKRRKTKRTGSNTANPIVDVRSTFKFQRSSSDL
jgi:hypothetical protein